LATGSVCGATQQSADTHLGYYRSPAIYDSTIVFVAEGDLWRTTLAGGVAQRLTTHAGAESCPAISPDGKSLAFYAQYEGPFDAYVMPLSGGLPKRLSHFGDARVVGWTPSGDVMLSTRQYAGLPDRQLVTVDPSTLAYTRVPLSQASEGSYDASGKTLYFTRFTFHGSSTKRYVGGTAQNLWRFSPDAPEAVCMTCDYPGTSKSPMWFNGRVYFVSDRDGIMNIWSMNENGSDVRQHTFHKDWDVKGPSVSEGRIAYQLGADIYVYDLSTGTDTRVNVALASDFDQMREKWITNPISYLTAAHLSPSGDRLALTARGQAFVAPVENGRLVEVTRKDGVRYRGARFMPDGKTVVMLSDESGEVEFWTGSADGMGALKQITTGGTILRTDGFPSPDGKMIAFTDFAGRLWIHEIASGQTRKVDSSRIWGIQNPTWSPDSRWLAFTDNADNELSRVFICDVKNYKFTPVTSDRYDNREPAWSSDGKWLYFLSNRNLHSVVDNPWEGYQPFPYLDKKVKLYAVPLVAGLTSPFEPDNELTPAPDTTKKSDSSITVAIDFTGIQERIIEVPVPAGNYSNLMIAGGQLLWLAWETGSPDEKKLQTIEIKSKDAEVQTISEGVTSYEISADAKKLLLRKGESFYVFDVGTSAPSELDKSAVNLSGWAFSLDPKEEWRQMFVDAWRPERDYFYDPVMHGVDWKGVLDKYLPLVDRITTRDELNDLISEVVAELSALHIFVYGGDYRKGPDDIAAASLGAVLSRDERAGGYVVEHVYLSDPDEPDKLGPLARPGVDVRTGDVITAVDGVPALGEPLLGSMLRLKTGKQVRLTVQRPGAKSAHDVIVEPISSADANDLRYREWEYTRRLEVEQKSDSQIGYVHLRAMGRDDYSQWARDFFPVLNRQGLIIDVRHNNGGNVDSWILTLLLRKPWLYWQSRFGRPYPNMQSTFNGHIVVLCDEFTISDGEMFAEGIRRLGLGKIIGTRTWGGEIWLSYTNVLVDNGIASAAESGAYGPEGAWVIEGHGVDPDIVVDNLPHETFEGKDAQLQAAIDYLKEQIRLNPVTVPPPPEFPDKSFQRK